MTAIPEWISALADAVTGCLLPVQPLAPAGCHVCRDGDGWEVSLFIGDTEIVGGRRDGVRKGSRFVADVMPILCLFDEVSDCIWQPTRFGSDDELGANLMIRGSCSGHEITLRILARAPRRFPPGRRANIHNRAWEELW